MPLATKPSCLNLRVIMYMPAVLLSVKVCGGDILVPYQLLKIRLPRGHF